jgi:polo-like kinase 1
VVSKAGLTKSKARQKLTSEIKIHRSLQHEHVVRFDRYFEDKDNVYMLLDICHNQSLSDLLKRRKRLHEVEARFYIKQLVQGISYVHDNHVIHRDLKLGNLFLTERMHLKIGDFGLAAVVNYDGDKKNTVCGTPNYLAPEVIMKQNDRVEYSYEVDYWAIGVILYVLLCGRPPFESQEVAQTYKKITVGKITFPDDLALHPFAKSFILDCLTVDPVHRLNLTGMLRHNFLAAAALPTQLPVSSLICPPSDQFVAQFALPDIQTNYKNQLASMLISPSKMRELGKQPTLVNSNNKTTPNVALMKSDSQQEHEQTPLKDTKVLISEFDLAPA